jgi:hypothetical protein
VIWFGGLILTVVGFIFGRVFNQSEQILSDKRRAYEAFLDACPAPNDAYGNWGAEKGAVRDLEKARGRISLYGSQNVMLAVRRYLEIFSEVNPILAKESVPLHPMFLKLAQAQNDVILEMRRDALAWSAFAYRGKSRIQVEVLEKSRNTLASERPK